MLKNFKEDFLESLLGFLWRQWSALGVQGYSDENDTWVIDPEALMLFSLTFSRYESRLFDEIMDWLDTHGQHIHIQRLRRIQNHEAYSSYKLLSAIAFIMAKRGKPSKWNRLASYTRIIEKPENLFYIKKSKQQAHFGATDLDFEKFGYLRGPLEFRGHTQSIQVMKNTGLLFRLRSLFGVNARAEILLYLLTHKAGHPRKIARECYYYQKTIQDALVEMGSSGIIRIQQRGKEKHYEIRKNDWYTLLQISGTPPVWITWPPLFRALEQVWLKINDTGFLDLDYLLQASELRKLMKTIRPGIEMAGFGSDLSDDSQHLGEAFTPVFVKDIRWLLERLCFPKK
ncbi:hypothetical protein GF407_00290 [candidate division KSB1 bacterium]|nr:hypothetical protein [candidate division KSB1 bacterium]